MAAADPSLPRAVIEAAIETVAPAGMALHQLAAALAADPGALSRGAPPMAGRLAAELIARGSAALTAPACVICGRSGRPLFRGDGGGVCQRCRAWQLAAACSACGKVKPVAGRGADGQPVCEVSRRHKQGHRPCGMCGTSAPIAVRARDGRPDICVNCYRKPAATCSICGRQRECSFAVTSHPVCQACSPRAAMACARCGQNRPPTARWPEGPVCDPCYNAALRHRGACTACGQQRRLVTPPGPDADTCADCAGIPVTHACTDCGREDKLYEKGRCARCSLHRRATELLSAGTGIIPPQMAGVSGAIGAARQPRSALNWLRKGAGASLLADAAAGRLALTHQALDNHPHQRAAAYLRHMLTAGGALPPRDEELARTGQWLTTLLETAGPPADRRLVQAYATWQVMRRLRTTAQHATRPRTPTAHARNNIRAAVNFLAWLRRRGTTLSTCGQACIDEWLTTRPSAGLAQDFLTWAAAHGHCPAFAIPAPPRPAGTAISQEQRWALASRLLHDTTLDPTDRVAGLLLLLYGQPLSRIAVITTSQITRRDDTVLIQLGRRDVPVPPTRRRHSQAHQRWPQPPRRRVPVSHQLAVPGISRTPNHPGRARRAPAGHDLRPGARRAALLDLAAQLPADLLSRPPRPARLNRRQIDTPRRRRLVPLRSRASPHRPPPALTNTPRFQRNDGEFSAAGKTLPTS